MYDRFELKYSSLYLVIQTYILTHARTLARTLARTQAHTSFTCTPALYLECFDCNFCI